MAKKARYPSAQSIQALADENNIITIKATPNAGENLIVISQGIAEPVRLHIRVTATAEDGKANEAILKLLSKALGVPKTTLTLVRGAKARVKRIQIG
ncbi:DUF167 domain-containing protein [Parasphingorhabdus sp. JC815]|uniref:DUF167 domain-containing protein n=1 Tax=Parasphingorhabdus sp. JC815 TaxID=3232140 RepID=UPI0034583EFE